MILRLISLKKDPVGNRPGPVPINIREMDCGNVYLANGNFNAAASKLFGYGVYDLTHDICEHVEILKIEE